MCEHCTPVLYACLSDATSHNRSQISDLYHLLTLLRLAACNQSALRLHTCVGEVHLGCSEENIQCRVQVLVQAMGQLALMSSAGPGPGVRIPYRALQQAPALAWAGSLPACEHFARSPHSYTASAPHIACPNKRLAQTSTMLRLPAHVRHHDRDIGPHVSNIMSCCWKAQHAHYLLSAGTVNTPPETLCWLGMPTCLSQPFSQVLHCSDYLQQLQLPSPTSTSAEEVLFCNTAWLSFRHTPSPMLGFRK